MSIPAGRFDHRKVGIDALIWRFQGLEIWHTQLHAAMTKLVAVDLTSFTKTTMLNLAMSIFLPTCSRYGEMLSTRPFLERQEEFSYSRYLGRTFEVGMWIGDYVEKNDMKYTDGLVKNRLRNTTYWQSHRLMDQELIVRNSSIRGNGDDGLASCQGRDGTESAVAENNKFPCTIRLNLVGVLEVLGFKKVMKCSTID